MRTTTCRWVKHSGFDSEWIFTQCRKKAGYFDNLGIKYCPYCGRKIVMGEKQ